MTAHSSCSTGAAGSARRRSINSMPCAPSRAVDPHGTQPRRGHCGGRQIVEADDRDVARDRHARIGEGVHQPDRGVVVDAEHAGPLGLAGLPELGGALDRGVAIGQDVEYFALGAQDLRDGGKEAAFALQSGLAGLLTDVEQMPVSGLQQEARRGQRAVEVIGRDAVVPHRRVDAVDQDERRIGAELVVHVGGHVEADEQGAVDCCVGAVRFSRPASRRWRCCTRRMSRSTPELLAAASMPATTACRTRPARPT